METAVVLFTRGWTGATARRTSPRCCWTPTSPTTTATGSGSPARAPTPGPYRRFNPIRQAERFDPDGEYVRRYVPELDRVKGGDVHQPWRLRSEVRRSLGYPAPLEGIEPVNWL